MKWEREQKTRISQYGLKECTEEFFGILDTQELNGAGKLFSPSFISSCRCLDAYKLKVILERMKELIE